MNDIYVGIDLDGTIAKYDSWKGLDDIGEPYDFVPEKMMALRKMGFKIIIYTCRSEEGYDKIREWLDENNIVYDYINNNPEQYDTMGETKVFAHHIIDDRSVGFESFDESVRLLSEKNPPKEPRCYDCIEYEKCKDDIDIESAIGCSGYMIEVEEVIEDG